MVLLIRTVTKIFTAVWDSHFSCHKQITTDQGRQFEASLINTLASITGSPLARTTSWYADYSGMIDRLGQFLFRLCFMLNINLEVINLQYFSK